jgi:hypothetical protein
MPEFVIGALVFCVLTASVAVFAARTTRIQNELSRLIMVFMMGLLALEWFFLAAYFLINPETFPREPNELRLLSAVIFPLLIQIPLFYGLIFLGVLNRRSG